MREMKLKERWEERLDAVILMGGHQELEADWIACKFELKHLHTELERLTLERDTDVFFAKQHMGPEVYELTQKLKSVTLERDRLMEAAEWIPVTERLPERNQNVLFWHKSPSRGTGAGWPAIADEWNDDHHLQYASHWKRLEPPTQPQPGGGDE